MKLSSAILTLFLVMDPLGNIPPFLSVLKDVHPDRRRRVLIREILIAYVVLLIFLFLGKRVLALLSLQPETISIAGGIVLFLIALRMIFPRERGLFGETLKHTACFADWRPCNETPLFNSHGRRFERQSKINHTLAGL